MTPTEQDKELRTIAGLKCPACKLSTLFLASGNYITCGNLQCREPDYAQAITADRKRLALEKEEMAIRYAIQTLHDTSKEYALENLQRQLDKNLAKQEEV